MLEGGDFALSLLPMLDEGQRKEVLALSLRSCARGLRDDRPRTLPELFKYMGMDVVKNSETILNC